MVPVEQSVGCVYAGECTDAGWKLSNETTFEPYIWHVGSTWPYPGRAWRSSSRSQEEEMLKWLTSLSKVWKTSYGTAAEKHTWIVNCKSATENPCSAKKLATVVDATLSDWLIDWVVVLRPTQQKIGHFRDGPQDNLLAWYGKTKTKPNTTKAHIHQSKEIQQNIFFKN